MAKATKTVVPPVPAEPIVEYTLILSEQEAKALQAVLACVDGNPKKSRRGLIAEIYSALVNAGCIYTLGHDCDIRRGSNIRFEDSI